VGKIFIKYDSSETAQKALKALAGRKFADRTVVVTYFGEASFLHKLVCKHRRGWLTFKQEYFDVNAW